MFHNYFFLKRLAQDLNAALTGFELLENYSQNKDELILGFAKDQTTLYLRANLDPQVSLINVSTDFKRAKKNSVDLFTELIGLRVTSVTVFTFERSLALSFENHDQLIFKMHASRSNILYAKGDKVVDVFRNSLRKDLSIQPSVLHKQLDLSKEHFSSLHGDFQQFLPVLGKEIKNHLSHLHYNNLSLDEKWQLIQQLLQDLDQNPISIYNIDDTPKLSLLDLKFPILLKTRNAIEACSKLYELYTRSFYLNSEKSKVKKTLDERIRKTESYLNKTQQKLDSVKSQRKYDEIANIIMANLHLIQKGHSQVTLYDFYSESDILIKLNPQLTPQKNAENLYRKSKNQQIEINKLEENLAQRAESILQMQDTLVSLEASENIKEIRKILPDEMALPAQQKSLPYHLYEFSGYSIMVGKNAKANDELTLKIANKNDLWLHAKDVAGSHVIVRQQAGKKIPKDVLERAAKLAAWFSKRKTDSLCPVIYTPKKFVRKRKGSPAGAVVVEKEEIIMIVPMNFVNS